jgi:hypothetical protein
MKQALMAAIAVALLAVGGDAAAQQRDSAAFLVRIGTDTVAVERYVRTPGRIVIEGLQRSPVTMLHRLSMDLGPRGRVTGGEWTATRPGASDPATRRTVRMLGDSAIITTVQGTTSREQRVAARDAILLAGPFYTPYEMAVMRAVAGGAARTEVSLLAGAAIATIPVERAGRDSVALQNQFGEPMRAHVDAQGRLLHLHTPAFTTVERLPWVDLDGLSTKFAARDSSGRGLGPLSPRAAARWTIGGASIWLDYSRPARRGRPIWGQLVPFGQVWRLGANDATHLATDRTIQLGDLTLAPGTYSLFLLPTADQWTLIVNRGTGMSGLDRDPDRDVGRVAMTLATTPQPAEQLTIELVPSGTGAILAVAWDRSRATVPIRVP